MDVTSATNARTVIATVLAAYPCGHKVPTLTPLNGRRGTVLALTAVANSVVFDYLVRTRLGGQSLTWSVLEETVVSAELFSKEDLLSRVTAKLTIAGIPFAPAWLCLRDRFPVHVPWKQLWAVTLSERFRLRCILDAIVSELFGQDWDDLVWIHRDCDHPAERMRDTSLYRTFDPKGFWRVDKEKDPELRHTVLTLAAFKDLKDTITAHGGDRDKGIEAFCTQNDGDGWMLPEMLRLDDLGLGRDRRAKEPQPVRSRLGDRFLRWQLEQSVEDSWAECERHARNILGEAGFAQLQAELRGETSATAAPKRTSAVAEAASSYDAGNLTLFGETKAPAKEDVRNRGK